jgi:hypothetical protein
VSNTLYERDFFGWATQQAALLRAGRLVDADIANIAEEIESMGRSEQNELVNRLAVVLLHLLKWRHQPSHRSRSWILSIKEQRIQLARHLRQNPSLKPFLDEAVADAYEVARVRASGETGLGEDAFPAQCPFTFAQAIADDYLPD